MIFGNAIGGGWLCLCVCAMVQCSVTTGASGAQTAAPNDYDSVHRSPTDCLADVQSNMTNRAATEDQLSCCSSLMVCRCKVMRCHTHQSDSACVGVAVLDQCRPMPLCDQSLTPEHCWTLPRRSWMGNNSWIWVAVVGAIVAVAVAVAIGFVFRRKFCSAKGGESGHKQPHNRRRHHQKDTGKKADKSGKKAGKERSTHDTKKEPVEEKPTQELIVCAAKPDSTIVGVSTVSSFAPSEVPTLGGNTVKVAQPPSPSAPQTPGGPMVGPKLAKLPQGPKGKANTKTKTTNVGFSKSALSRAMR